MAPLPHGSPRPPQRDRAESVEERVAYLPAGRGAGDHSPGQPGRLLGGHPAPNHRIIWQPRILRGHAAVRVVSAMSAADETCPSIFGILFPPVPPETTTETADPERTCSFANGS